MNRRIRRKHAKRDVPRLMAASAAHLAACMRHSLAASSPDAPDWLRAMAAAAARREEAAGAGAMARAMAALAIVDERRRGRRRRHVATAMRAVLSSARPRSPRPR